MTREEKLYSMRMMDLVNVAEKLGIKINTKAAKSKAIEKILEAEADKEWEDGAKPKTEIKPEVEPVAESESIAEPEVKPDPVAEPEEPKEPKASKKRENLKIKELTYNGETLSIREWAEKLEMSWPTLYDRINRNGWSVEDALTTPLGQRRPK